MAIFGSFTDMQLSEVLSMVGRSGGSFQVNNLPDGSLLELHVSSNFLRGCFVNGVRVETVLHVQDALTEIMKHSQGDFQFLRTPAEQLDEQFNIPLDQLLLSCLASLDEIADLRENLPNPDTVFEIAAGVDVWLEQDLHEFYNAAYPYLVNGSSAESLAQETALHVDQILLFLYKLRLTGVISPRRAFRHRPPEPVAPEPEPVLEAPAVIDESVETAEDEAADIPAAAQTAAPPDGVPVTESRQPAGSGGFLQRILKALSLKLG